MSVATLLRAPAPHRASSFALAALSLKGVRSAFSALGFLADEEEELPASVSRRVSGAFVLQKTHVVAAGGRCRCLCLEEVTEGSDGGMIEGAGCGVRESRNVPRPARHWSRRSAAPRWRYCSEDL